MMILSAQMSSYMTYQDLRIDRIKGVTAVINEVEGYLLRSPYTNLEALTVLDNQKYEVGSDAVSALRFTKSAETVAIALMADGVSWLTPMKADVMPQVLNFFEELGIAADEKGNAGFMMLQSSDSYGPQLVEEWTRIQGRVAHSETSCQYYLYNDLLCPNLPVSKFDDRVRPANELDLPSLASAHFKIPVEELDGIPLSARAEFEKNVQQRPPLVILGGEDDLVSFAAYDVGQIGTMGSYLRTLDTIVNPSQELMDKGMPAVLQAMEREMVDQFAAVARLMKSEGRWFMCSHKKNEQMPIASIAGQLKFEQAGANMNIGLVSFRQKAQSPAAAV